ncbi:negative acting factor protein [Rutstroemia sp. NJR-2017a BBW]|nr:negative acting factor protein [Rutstroemia sp. NJR-2017a BBW]
MVNTGKPSKGCYLCRARRIKCDEAKPHCMRCQKSKRQCPGYRDASELSIREHAKAMKRKASMYFGPGVPAFKVESYNHGQPSISRAWKKAGDSTGERDLCHKQEHRVSAITLGYSSYQPPESGTLGSPASAAEFNADRSVSMTIPKQFSPPIDQRAMCFFLSNFVLLPNTKGAKGHLGFLLPLVKEISKNSTLFLTLNAVALAALANQPNSRALQPAADSQYGSALNQINKDLQDAKKAQQDSTLASVYLLSLYEQISSYPVTLSGWVSHIDGAVALLKTRGKANSNTDIGRALFDAIRSHMIVQSMGHSKNIREAHDWWTTFAIGDPVQHQISILNMKVADLRADSHRICTLKAHTVENVEKVLQHLREAQAIDQEYINWHEDLPEVWKPKFSFWINKSLDTDMETTNFYPGRVDTYRDLWMATTHSMARVSRLFIFTSILRCTAWLTIPLNCEESIEYITISKQARILIEEIIASIPYFLGHETEDKSISAFTDSYFPCGSGTKIGGTGVSGMFAMWPIFAAIGSDFTSDSQRSWLRGRLKYIAETLGMHQAKILLQLPTRYPSTFICRDRSAKLNVAVPQGVPGGTHPTAKAV